MKATYAVILYFVHVAAFDDGCSGEDFGRAVENAVVSCTSNISCDAKCYRGYIFPTGSREESYNCQNAVWTPLLLACKRFPVVYVTYAAIWEMKDVLPILCDNVLIRLKESTDKLEEKFTNFCNDLFINTMVKLTYSIRTFQVSVNLKAEYQHFFNWKSLDTCISITTLSNSLNQTLADMFKGVTCNDSTLNSSILKSLFIHDRYENCSTGKVIYNVTKDAEGQNELYCDFEITGSTPHMTTTVSTIVTTILGNFTSETDAKLNVTYGYSNTMTPTTFKVQFSESGLESISKIYIAAAAGGVSLILIIVVVCIKMRLSSSKRPEKLEMPDRIKSQDMHSGFKGELIENELYQSADNVIDCKNNMDTVCDILEDSNTALKYPSK
ncbi:uncharacterized protein LOC128186318 isoform X1 [Crassostrea angulata]|uniref:uncharacterized protein LOC128186318 isoform X1 n=1 Tax=Magallana angulata TaxID=2784310 RepID=UPI0022B0FFB2|nr:uncharacterized protein LOC128186318 isoform X1 [Crassostrea angulata]